VLVIAVEPAMIAGPSGSPAHGSPKRWETQDVTARLGALESTLRSASDRGYVVVLVPDACAMYHEVLQADLWRKESGIIQVRSVARMLA
jgi:hypothetical protein